MLDDVWINDIDLIGESFVAYYKLLFQSSNPILDKDLERLIKPTITLEQNAEMPKIPSSEKVKDVVFNMAPTKAPGPDGMSAIFFQHYWEIVGRDMVFMVKNFFRQGHMLRELNHTHITLIPTQCK